jgi:predicted transcriptional regulator
MLYWGYARNEDKAARAEQSIPPRRGVCVTMPGMTKLLEEAIKKVRELPEADQDEAAEMLLSVASKSHEPVRLDEETRTAVREGLRQAERGEFVGDEDMAAFFRRHGVKRQGK